jgi:hypothetical protein
VEAFRLANGELMTPDKFMERTRMLTQTRTTLERAEAKLVDVLNDNARLQKEKEVVVNECKRYETLLSRFDTRDRYEVFSNESHRLAVIENHKLVDQVDTLQRSLSEAREEILILSRRPSAASSVFVVAGGKVPAVCPLGGCLNYDDVGGDMGNFQKHMDITHRVLFFY